MPVLAFLLAPAADALSNAVSFVVVGLAMLLIAEQELLRAARDDRGPRAPLMPRAPTAALLLAVGIIFVLRVGELAG